MSSIDNRIVAMKFDNASFESGVGTTLGTLDRLKQALHMPGASKGLNEVQDAANRLNLGPIDGAVTGISKSFLAMSTVAITALANVTSKVVDAGLSMAKSLTLDPIMAGFGEYELKMGSIQTILSNTARYGTSLGDVTKNLDELNKYADKTIYNFGDMTKNIGLFTNAGIRIEDATSMIKGFSNEAASSGTNAQGAASAAYQLSQALSAGTIRLMDWRSLQNVGMGNKNMQNGLIEIADAMGTLNSHGITAAKVQENFNGSLEKNWLSADVMSSYLKIMAGDMSEAEQKTLGLTDAQVKAFADQQQMSEDAATKVRTFTQLVSTLREGVGSSWSETFDLLIGDFNQATDLWTSVNDTLSGILGKMGEARNKLLGDWAELGGRDLLINSLADAFKALGAILKPIGQAFKSVFPTKTGEDLLKLTQQFRHFTANLEISGETADQIKRIFKGVFSIFSIAIQVIKGVAGVIGDLIGKLSDGSGGFLEIVANIGDFITGIDQAIKSGDGLSKFFDGLSRVLQVPIGLLQAVAGYIRDLFGSGPDESVVAGPIGVISKRLSPFQTLIENVKGAFDSLGETFQKVKAAAQPLIDWLANALGSLGDTIANAFSTGDFDTILDAVNTGLFGGLVLLVKKFLDGGGIFGQSGAKGMFDSISGTFNQLTGVLTTMQQDVKADILLKIAGAVGILTISIVALSMIDSDKLTKALTAIGVAFAELLAAMKILENIGNSKGFLKMPAISIAMIALATAILILTAAVKNLSELSWSELGKGLTGVAGIMAILAAAVKPLSANSSGMISAGTGMVFLAVGLKVMASAVKDFAEIAWSDIIHGLAGIAGALLVVAGSMQLMPKNMPSMALGILILAGALKLLATAVETFGAMDWGVIGKGLGTIGAALLIIAGSMRLMPKNMIVTAAGLLLVAVAVNGISRALGQLGGMSFEEIKNGLIALGGSLLILALGLKMMNGSLAGSAALLVAAGALAVLTPILITLGNMSWQNIVTGLLAIAGVFLVLGVAGLALAPVSPIIALLGVALLGIGAGLALAGVGALAFATALGILAGISAAGAVAIGQILATIIDSIPAALKAFGEGIIAFADAISHGGPQFVSAMTVVMLSILQAIQNVIPQIGETISKLIDTLLEILVDSIPKMVDAGLKIVTGILKGIRDNIGEMVTIAGQIIVKFINGISYNLGEILEAGTNLLLRFIKGVADNAQKVIDKGADIVIDFLNGVAASIRKHSAEFRTAGGNIASAIVSGITGGLTDKIGDVAAKAKEMASRAVSAVTSFLKIGSPSKVFEDIGGYIAEGFAKGLVGGLSDVDVSLKKMNELVTEALNESIGDVAAAQKKLKSLQNAKKPNKKAIAEAKQALAEAKATHAEAVAANDLMTQSMLEQQNQLRNLGAAYDDVTTKLSDARKSLEDAVAAQENANRSITSQYDDLPDITEKTSLSSYEKQLEKSISATNKFKATLDQLRALGMDDTTYQKFLDEGVEIQPFLDKLLAGGSAEIQKLNSLNAQLATAAGNLGAKASTDLYQAGVDAARGLVAGLESQQASIEASMTVISNALINAIKKALQIQSPSKAFYEIGKFSNAGLAKGLISYSSMAVEAATTVGTSTLDAMKETMARISEIAPNEINMAPVITPVLDLSNIRKDATKISAMLAGQASVGSVSFGQASGISQTQAETKAAMVASQTRPEESIIKFEQNNYSPKTLSASEIYRNTRNQLSLAKEALSL